MDGLIRGLIRRWRMGGWVDGLIRGLISRWRMGGWIDKGIHK